MVGATHVSVFTVVAVLINPVVGCGVAATFNNGKFMSEATWFAVNAELKKLVEDKYPPNPTSPVVPISVTGKLLVQSPMSCAFVPLAARTPFL